MAARLRIYALSALLLALLACSVRPRVLLCLDPYSAELLARRAEQVGGSASPWVREIEGLFGDAAEVRIETVSAASGLDGRATSAGEPEANPSAPSGQLAHLVEVMQRRSPDWVYLSPALDFAPAQVTGRFPDTVFLVEAPAGGGPANLVSVVYQRSRAHRQAGEALGRLIREPEFRARIGMRGSNQGDVSVGILVAISNLQVEIEIEEFRRGLSLSGEAEWIERKNIDSLSDRVKARRLLEKMKEQGVGVVLLKTYTLSGSCLEFLQKEGGVAIAEDALAAAAFEDTVLLSLEDDFYGALLEVKELLMEGFRPQPDTAQTIEAPVRLVWGKPYGELAGRILAGAPKP